MRVVALVAGLLLAPLIARAECAILPVCMLASNPPVDGLRLYEAGLLKRDWPKAGLWFNPAGPAQFGIPWCTSDLDAVLKICVYQGTKETCGSATPPSGATVPAGCGSQFVGTTKMRDQQNFGKLFASAPATCLGDPACSSIVFKQEFDRCLADPICSAELIQTMPDVDHDGVKTVGDRSWWEYIFGPGKQF